MYNLILAYCGAATVALAAGGAGAQTADLATSLEEVVITATRTTSRLQDVPMAVSAISAEQLDRRQVTDLETLTRAAPGLLVSDGPGGGSTPMFFMRGNGTDNDVFTLDPAIGVYVDGVYYARTMGSLVPFFDLERIEVLRGPQGALYGRNTVQGAIRIITRKPSLDTRTFGAEATFGSYDRLDFKVAANGPLADEVAGSISYIRRSRDGYMRNLTLGTRAADKDEHSGRAALLFAPTDDLRITLRGDVYIDRSFPTAASSRANNPDGDVLTYESELLGQYNKVNAYTGSATIEWSPTNSLEFTSTTALRDLALRTRFDADASTHTHATPAPRNVFETNRQELDSRQFSQEVVGVLKLGGPTPVELTGGLFYFEEDSSQVLDITIPPRLRLPIPKISQDTQSWAGFAQIRATLGEGFNVTAAARYTDESKDLAGRDTIAGSLEPNKLAAWDDLVTVGVDTGRWTWSLSADYKVASDTLLYANYATGFRSAGYDGYQVTAEDFLNSLFKIETNETWEIGVKSELIDRRLRLNLNYFDSRIRDLQRSVTTTDATGGLATINVSADVAGIELDASAVPAPGLTLSLGGSWITKMDVRDGPGVWLPKTPRVSGSLAVSYERPLDNGGVLMANADAYYSSRYFSGLVAGTGLALSNDPITSTGPYTIINASLGYRLPDGRWTFTAGVTNIGDETFAPQTFNFPFAQNVIFPSEPRMWFVSARVNF